ncbi:hypothetical protein FOZ63_006295, partial [Perkinsus olseni]
QNLHINALELIGIYFALARVRLMEFDTKMKFSDIRVHCDSLTAVAIARDRRAPTRSHTSISKDNPADLGTRSDLVDNICKVRATYDDLAREQKHAEKDASPPSGHTAFPVRKCDDSFADDSIAKRVRLRRSAQRDNPPPDLPPGCDPRDSQHSPQGLHRCHSSASLDAHPTAAASTSSSSTRSAKTTDDLPSTRLVEYAFTRLPDDLILRLRALEVIAGITQVPDADLQHTLTALYHDTYHEGTQATYTRMKAFYQWPKMLDTISAVTRTCLLCARVLTNAGDLAWKQRPTPPALPRQPFTDIALDVHGPYFGNLYVLTCTCRLTTYLLCKPLSTAPLTSDVIEFLNSLTCTYGTIPERIRSDNGSIFCKAAHQIPTVA